MRREGVHIIEIGSRMGGDCNRLPIWYLFPQDRILRENGSADCSRREAGTELGRPLQKCSAIRFIMDQKDLETLKHIEEKYPQNVVEKGVGRPAGEELHPVTDSSSRFGFYIFQTDTDGRNRTDAALEVKVDSQYDK